MTAARTIPFNANVRFPQPPTALKAAGKKAWKAAKELWDEGSIIRRDLQALEQYCKDLDQIVECETAYKNEGKYTITENGAWMAHPAIKERNDAIGRVMKWQKEFGLIPSAHSEQANANPANTKGVAQRKR